MRKLTGGLLLKDEMRLWPKYPDAAAELVNRGYWRDEDDWYVIVLRARHRQPRHHQHAR
jgi:hypothetical protein